MVKMLVEIDLMKLKLERVKKGYSQGDVAKELGIKATGYGTKELGKSPFTEEELNKLLKMYKLKMKDVLKK